MRLEVVRKPNKFFPDPKRVIARYFQNSDQRTAKIILNILKMPETEVIANLNHILNDFSKRHRNITRILVRNFHNLKSIFNDLGIEIETVPLTTKLLIGSCFTSEYSIEAAAFFNPSIVEHPDQSELEPGQKRIIVSLRATGEGHISSIVFKTGIITRTNELVFDPDGPLVGEAEVVKLHTYHKKDFIHKLNEMRIYKSTLPVFLLSGRLGESFSYDELQECIAETEKSRVLTPDEQLVLEEINWLASTHYETTFSLDTSISERVIFPVSPSERNGIEDARFVRFTDDDGKVTYYATYTAYDGVAILPMLLATKDFYQFKMQPLHGDGAQNKNAALFPRKVNGQFVMLSRIDGVNNYVMFSDSLYYWSQAIKIMEPKYTWEFVKVGNCGSPIETSQGWLVVTHGVGPMREYSIGAALLDLNDPTKVIGRLRKPLLIPNAQEREGYVPNVVYSCGSIIHNGELIIPYAISDYATTFASVSLDALLKEIHSDGI
ncbi:MAG: glycoside hydrolase family 130 protein [Bacteroidota bacterium]|nr:glycoside hydrolase family 130 protein [Bacteroidota bacterium]